LAFPLQPTMLSTRHLLLLFGGVCSIFLLLSIQFKGPADGYEGDEESLSDDLLEFEPLNPDQGQDLHILPVPELSHRPVHQVEQDDGISFEKSPSQDGGADALAFRKQLESSTSFTSHSPTLTFTHIYVVSLPTRQDRRANMSRIADALNLKFTFIDAVLKDSHLIQWIGERVAETRVKKRPHLAKALGVLPEEVGGMGIGSIWLSRQGDQGNGGELQLPSLNEPKYDNLDWVAYLDKATDTTGTPLALEQDKEPLEERLQPNDPNFNVTAALWDSVEPMESRQIVAAVLSTWFSHTRAMKAMLANGDESALFLEDDVDIEWDIEGRWASIYRRLPSDWDVVFLGHCWGREMTSASLEIGAVIHRLKFGFHRANQFTPASLHISHATLSARLCAQQVGRSKSPRAAV
jgi:GR25 family glycosyltransferase involved in LPS biosynthesis